MRATGRLLLLAAAALLPAGGCRTFSGPTTDGDAITAPSANAPVANYYVEFYPHSGRPTRIERPLVGTMFVHDALDEARARRRFRRMNVYIVRTAPGTDRAHRMVVEYPAAARNQTAQSTNFALHPEDRIVVEEDTSSFLNDLSDRLLGPMFSGTR